MLFDIADAHGRRRVPTYAVMVHVGEKAAKIRSRQADRVMSQEPLLCSKWLKVFCPTPQTEASCKHCEWQPALVSTLLHRQRGPLFEPIRLGLGPDDLIDEFRATLTSHLVTILFVAAMK